MRVLSIVHERDAGSGVFAQAAAARGDELIEWIPAEGPEPALQGFDAVLVFGGGMHVDEERAHPWLSGEKRVLSTCVAEGMPMLGVCLGAQLVAEVAGGSARPAAEPEVGWKSLRLTSATTGDALLGPLPERFESFQWHSYELAPPAGAVSLAHSETCLQAFRLTSAAVWGIQFHAEVTEATVANWLRDYGEEPDAVRAGVNREAILADTRREIGGWNELGMGICTRFLREAAA
jgi:GMP synthase-like glutamine amidotransferase